MTLYRRRLPHINLPNEPTFLTWRLQDCLPPNRCFPADSLTSGQAFAHLDRLLDQARTGPFYLAQPAIAALILKAIRHNSAVLKHYQLHAYAIMPNHVHLLVTPTVVLPTLTKSLKGITAKQSNLILGRTGQPFWQPETYDHQVRNNQEFEKIRHYIEQNPVKAGLVKHPSDYEWSSASKVGRPPGRPLLN